MDEKQEAALLLELVDTNKRLGEMGKQLQRIEDGVEELTNARTSKIEITLEQQRTALESMRAKARSPLQSLVEFEGPAGIKGKLIGFGGLTFVVAVIAGVAGVVAYLLLR